MTDVLFVQGAGEDVHAEWDSKLVDSLRRELGARYDVRYPSMPNEADPQYADWKAVLERQFARVGAGTVVIGHSVGGAILVNVLAESAAAIPLGAIVLIAAPFIGDGGWATEDMAPSSDLRGRLPAGVPVLLYHGENDNIVPVAHVKLYSRVLPEARVRRLPGRDHQLNNDLAEVAEDIRALTAP